LPGVNATKVRRREKNSRSGHNTNYLPLLAPSFRSSDKKTGPGIAAAPFASMIIALVVWMGISTVATVGIVSALALASRRHIPTIETEPVSEPLIVLNHGAATGDAKLSSSFAQ
jgi:hypothetical protein